MSRSLFAKLIPRRVRELLERRVFYAVFNTTRVTNDAYGWRPDPIDSERNTAENRSADFIASEQEVNEAEDPEGSADRSAQPSKH